MNENIKEQIELIANQLPILYPAQLYLRKGDQYVQSYDPVYEIFVKGNSVEILGYDKFTHTLDDFDSIYIVPNGDEPVVLNSKEASTKGGEK